jgi:hypothetical protein
VRRRTMFVSLAILVVFTFGFGYIGLVNAEALTSMGVLIGWVYGTFSVPVVGYFGNTITEDFAKRKQ